MGCPGTRRLCRCGGMDASCTPSRAGRTRAPAGAPCAPAGGARAVPTRCLRPGSSCTATPVLAPGTPPHAGDAGDDAEFLGLPGAVLSPLLVGAIVWAVRGGSGPRCVAITRPRLSWTPWSLWSPSCHAPGSHPRVRLCGFVERTPWLGSRRDHRVREEGTGRGSRSPARPRSPHPGPTHTRAPLRRCVGANPSTPGATSRTRAIKPAGSEDWPQETPHDQ